MQFLLIFCLASSALALKTLTLCPNEQANEFVCAVQNALNKEESYSKFESIADITIGNNGQEEFYNSTKALEVLREALRTQSNTEALKQNPRSWFETLGKVTGQLESAKTGTQKLANSIVPGLKKLQASYEKTTTANAKKVEEQAADATKELSQEINQRAITYASDEYKAAVEKCKSAVSKEVEVLQGRTEKVVEKAYDSLIDLTDQIGLCIQSKDTQGKCARTVQTKSNGLKSLGRTAEQNAAKIVDLGKKSFEKDSCLQKALRTFDTSVKKILKDSPKNE